MDWVRIRNAIEIVFPIFLFFITFEEAQRYRNKGKRGFWVFYLVASFLFLVIFAGIAFSWYWLALVQIGDWIGFAARFHSG